MGNIILDFYQDPAMPPEVKAKVAKMLDNPLDRQQATKDAEALIHRTRFLIDRIDRKGQEILDSRTAWEDEILQFSHPYDELRDDEKSLVDERINYWKDRCTGA